MRHLPSELVEPARIYPRTPWGEGWTPAGVVEVLEPWVNQTRRSRIQAVLDSRLESVTVLLDAPHDPHNGAAILRSCDAFGIQQVHVLPKDGRFHASNTVSKGAERWVEVVEHPSPAAAVAELVRREYELVVTHPQGDLLPEDLATLPRVALVLGNEHVGIREEVSKSAGRSVRIPMNGFVESLNVSVASGILLRCATLGRPGDLSSSAWEALYARGLARSVQKSAEILAASEPR